MIIDHNSKSQLIIFNTALFYIRKTTASASKQNIFWHENEEIVKCCLNNKLYYRNLSSVENWVNNILLISIIKQE